MLIPSKTGRKTKYSTPSDCRHIRIFSFASSSCQSGPAHSPQNLDDFAVCIATRHVTLAPTQIQVVCFSAIQCTKIFNVMIFFASRNMSWIGVTKIAVAMSKVVVRVVEGRCGYFLLHCLATGSLHHQETHTLGKPQSHCRPYHQQSSTSLPSTNIKLFLIDGIWIFWAKATQFKLSYRPNL